MGFLMTQITIDPDTASKLRASRAEVDLCVRQMVKFWGVFSQRACDRQLTSYAPRSAMKRSDGVSAKTPDVHCRNSCKSWKGIDDI